MLVVARLLRRLNAGMMGGVGCLLLLAAGFAAWFFTR